MALNGYGLDFHHDAVPLRGLFHDVAQLVSSSIHKKIHDFRLLVDENLPPNVIPGIGHDCSFATHIAFEHLLGHSDQDVWAWAVNNHIDAIVTHDRAEKPFVKSVNGELVYIPPVDITSIATESALRMMERGGDVAFDALPLIVQVTGFDGSGRGAVAMFDLHKDAIYRHIAQRESPYIKISPTAIHNGPRFPANPKRPLHADQGQACVIRTA